MCELTRHNKKSEKWQVKLINEDVPKMKITGVPVHLHCVHDASESLVRRWHVKFYEWRHIILRMGDVTFHCDVTFVENNATSWCVIH